MLIWEYTYMDSRYHEINGVQIPMQRGILRDLTCTGPSDISSCCWSSGFCSPHADDQCSERLATDAVAGHFNSAHEKSVPDMWSLVNILWLVLDKATYSTTDLVNVDMWSRQQNAICSLPRSHLVHRVDHFGNRGWFKGDRVIIWMCVCQQRKAHILVDRHSFTR